MEYLGVIASFIFLISPIYFKLFKIEHRLTKVEGKVGFLYEKNGGKE